MTYRSILVLLDQHPSCEARTQIAIQLAKDLDRHLAGLAPTGVVDGTPCRCCASPGACRS